MQDPRQIGNVSNNPVCDQGLGRRRLVRRPPQSGVGVKKIDIAKKAGRFGPASPCAIMAVLIAYSSTDARHPRSINKAET
jgi:hypothetical protein